MKQNNYFTKSRNIGNELNNEFKRFCLQNNFESISRPYLEKNIHFIGSQFVAGFCSKNSKIDMDDVLLTPIVIEHIMLKAYYTNALLDEKQSVWKNKETIKQTILDEVHMTSLLEQLRINAKTIYDVTEQKFLEQTFSKMISSISKGFIVEQNINYLRNGLDSVLINWDKKYTERNMLFNLVYDYSPLIGYGLATKDTSIISEYESKVPPKLRLSYAGQVINDFSDFSSEFDSRVKKYSDRFSDLKNGIFTLPIFELYKCGDLDDYLGEPGLVNNKLWQKKLVNRIKKNKINEKIIQIGKDSYVANINFWKEKGIENNFLYQTYAITTHSKYLHLK